MSGASFESTYKNIAEKQRENFEKSTKKIIRISSPTVVYQSNRTVLNKEKESFSAVVTKKPKPPKPIRKGSFGNNGSGIVYNIKKGTLEENGKF